MKVMENEIIYEVLGVNFKDLESARNFLIDEIDCLQSDKDMSRNYVKKLGNEYKYIVRKDDIKPFKIGDKVIFNYGSIIVTSRNRRIVNRAFKFQKLSEYKEAIDRYKKAKDKYYYAISELKAVEKLLKEGN